MAIDIKLGCSVSRICVLHHDVVKFAIRYQAVPKPVVIAYFFLLIPAIIALKKKPPQNPVLTYESIFSTKCSK